MADRVLTCVVWDESTSTCTTQAWVEPDGFWPALSVDDAHAITMAIVGLWMAAYLFNWLARDADRHD
jgi:hypothetical protein